MNVVCRHGERLLSGFLDGELAEPEVSSFKAHLDSCEWCREELGSFRELSRVLAARTEPDPLFVARFRARLEELLGSDPSFQLWRRLAVRLLPVAAAALLTAAAAIWLSVEEAGWDELEARQLGDGFIMAAGEVPNPMLEIAFEPFPGGER